MKNKLFSILFLLLFTVSSYAGISNTVDEAIFNALNDTNSSNKTDDIPDNLTLDLSYPDSTTDANETEGILDKDVTADQNQTETMEESFYYFSTLTPEEDPFIHYKWQLFWKDHDYEQNLVRNRHPFFFIEELDIHNITVNSNVALRTPFTQIPFGGLSTVLNSDTKHSARGFDFGFYFRMEHLLNGRLMLSALNSFSFNGSFLTLLGADVYPLFENRKLKLSLNGSIYTTAPQYQLMAERNSKLGSMISKITDKLNLDFHTTNKTGTNFIAGVEYLFPFAITSFSALKLNYEYTDAKLVDEYSNAYPAKKAVIQESTLFLSFVERITIDMQKQDKTILTGNYFSLTASIDLPLLNAPKQGRKIFQPDFSIIVADSFSKKLYKDYAVKARAIAGYHYNYRTNLSGDGGVRGLSIGDFTGFAYCIANFDILLPIAYVDLYRSAAVSFPKKVNYLIYLSLFFDGGIAFSNDSLRLRGNDFNFGKKYLEGKRFYIDDSNYLNYAFSSGIGLNIVPYFLHFIVKIEVGINILEPILTHQAPSVGLTVSFNNMF